MARFASRLPMWVLGLGLLGAGELAGAPAHPSGQRLADYTRDAWTVDDGLPQATVNDILQTRDGYLWLATWEGPTRFDGQTFTVLDPGPDPQREDNIKGVQLMLESSEGSLWFGTLGAGLHRLRDGRWTSLTQSDGLASNVVLALAEGADGSLWIGTDKGLSRYRSGKFSTMTMDQGLPSNSVIALEEDRSGRLWIGTYTGLSYIENGRLMSRTLGVSASVGGVQALYEDRSGTLWVSTNGSGLLGFVDGALRDRYTTEHGLGNNDVHRVCEDGAGNLWIGTYGGGLSRLRGGRIERFDGLTNNNVTAVVADREGSIWVGTHAGLNRLKVGPLATLTERNGLSDDFVRTIFEDESGALWVGTSNGLNRFDGERFRVYGPKQGLTSAGILALSEDRQGDLWIGTHGGGLNRMRDGRFSAYTAADGLGSNTVRALCASRDGSLWIGTSGGLNRLHDGKIELFGANEGLASEFVISLIEDHSGRLWIGTGAGGYGFEKGKIRRLTPLEGFSSGSLFSFYEDGDGAMWMGTDGGLGRWKDGIFQSVTQQQGLFSNVVFQILEDAAGNLWMSSPKGIFRASRRQLEAVARGEQDRVSCVAYGKPDGMESMQCNGSSQPAGWKTRDGRLWFPTAKGIARIDPGESFARNELPPPVAIESLFVDHQPVTLEPEVRVVVAPGSHRIQFSYVGLSFLVPERVRFRNRLEGFDRDWTDAGTERTAQYTNLPPGDYRFRVIACNNDGVWNETGAAVDLRITPFFRQTPWFYALVVTLAVAAALALYTLRVRGLHLRERDLETKVAKRTLELAAARDEAVAATLAKSSFVANMSHELRTPLNAILGYTEMLIEQTEIGEPVPSGVASDLAKLRSAGRQQLELLNDMLDLSKVEAGKMEVNLGRIELGELIEEVVATARPLLARNDNRLEIRVEAGAGAIVADAMKLRQSLLNLFSNAAKFTSQGTVELEVWRESGTAGDQVLFRLRDSGIGMTQDQMAGIFEPFTQAESATAAKYGGTGLGLALTRRFCQLMGGDVEVESEAGRGSTFTIRLPARTPTPPLPS